MVSEEPPQATGFSLATTPVGAGSAAGSFGGGVALVTGGSQGLGYAVADRLMAQGAAGLLLVGRDPAKGAAAAASLSTSACRAEFISADLADSDACEAVVTALDDTFGTCHSFVNCAALTARGSVWDSSPRLWDAMLAVNVKAPALLTQGVARIMARERAEGTVVLIGSVAARGGPPRLLPYATSKAALVAMTRNLAFALMRHRIRVNLLCPGWMDTPNEDVVQRTFDGATDGWLESAEAQMPFGRLIKPAEIARTIVHLATADSGMMTGSVLDWDQTVSGAGDSIWPGPELGPDAADWHLSPEAQHPPTDPETRS